MSENLTAREAAKYLGYAYTTLNTSRHTGTLAGSEAPKFFKRARTVFYKKASCDEWLDALSSTEVTKTSDNAAANLWPTDDDTNDIAIGQVQ